MAGIFHTFPCRVPSGNDNRFSASTAVIKRVSNHETYQQTVYDSLSTSRLTNCTLLGYSINTDCQTTKFMKLGVSKLLSQTHYCVGYCVSCEHAVSVFLDTCTYNRAQGLF